MKIASDLNFGFLFSNSGNSCHGGIIAPGKPQFMCYPAYGLIQLHAYDDTGKIHLDDFYFPTSCSCALMGPSPDENHESTKESLENPILDVIEHE